MLAIYLLILYKLIFYPLLTYFFILFALPDHKPMFYEKIVKVFSSETLLEIKNPPIDFISLDAIRP